jgi:KaiC/GvpD/RAD55 family RecA-like ATPase
MLTLKIAEPWLRKLLPQGWPTGTSTLITGPGGSGKPLIANVIVSNWLRQGGSVVFMSLQYPSSDFIAAGLERTTGEDLADHQGRFTFIELDAAMEGLEILSRDRIRGNLVKPAIWAGAVDAATSFLPREGPGVLVVGSALNLLLFSPTYGKDILAEIKETMARTDTHTSLFSVSSSAKKEMVSELEEFADNLLVSRSSRDPFRLFLRIERMREVSFKPGEVEVPISEETLAEVKAVADHSRRRVIPLISSI